MLFTSHRFDANTCGFCNHETKNKVETFGYNSTNEKAAICSKCLINIICNALYENAKTTNHTENIQCDFCGQSLPEIIRLFTNGDLSICEECIANLVSTSLWIGKKQGVEIVSEKYLINKENN